MKRYTTVFFAVLSMLAGTALAETSNKATTAAVVGPVEITKVPSQTELLTKIYNELVAIHVELLKQRADRGKEAASRADAATANTSIDYSLKATDGGSIKAIHVPLAISSDGARTFIDYSIDRTDIPVVAKIGADGKAVLPHTTLVKDIERGRTRIIVDDYIERGELRFTDDNLSFERIKLR